jgi:hypothetical protein
MTDCSSLYVKKHSPFPYTDVRSGEAELVHKYPNNKSAD